MFGTQVSICSCFISGVGVLAYLSLVTGCLVASQLLIVAKSISGLLVARKFESHGHQKT